MAGTKVLYGDPSLIVKLLACLFDNSMSEVLNTTQDVLTSIARLCVIASDGHSIGCIHPVTTQVWFYNEPSAKICSCLARGPVWTLNFCTSTPHETNP